MLSGTYGDYRGNVYNAYQHTWTNGTQYYGLRGGLTFRLTDALKFTLRGDFTHNNDNCCADILGPIVPNAGLTNILLPEIAPVKAYFGSKEVYDDLTPQTKDSNGGVSGQFDWTFDGFTLTSITAWRDWRNKQIRDGDFHAGCCRYVNLDDVADRDFGALNYNQYSEELRIASPSGRRLTYVAGAFFWYTDENDWFNRFLTRCTSSTLPADATGSQPCSPAPGVSTFAQADGAGRVEHQVLQPGPVRPGHLRDHRQADGHRGPAPLPRSGAVRLRPHRRAGRHARHRHELQLCRARRGGGRLGQGRAAVPAYPRQHALCDLFAWLQRPFAQRFLWRVDEQHRQDLARDLQRLPRSGPRASSSTDG